MNWNTYPVPGKFQIELDRLGTPPRTLWAEGNLDLLTRLPEEGIAIVGTRYPRKRALEFVDRMVQSLPRGRFVVISGFARGIDARAHEAAIRAGLPTIAVMACGLDQTYPSDHQDLRKRIIADGGLLLSEFAPGKEPYKSNFLERNRWIALLAQATCVIEAPDRSGTLNTARWATELGRDLYAVPAFPDDPYAKGNEKLLDDRFAEPLWGAHSLGKTWLTLATGTGAPVVSLLPDEKALDECTRELRARRGDCEETMLYGEFLERGWSPERFRAALEGCLKAGALRREAGSVMRVH